MIIKEQLKNTKQFKDLELGDVFKYRGDIYIKCHTLQISDDDPIVYNVFQLNNSCNYHLQDNTFVHIVEYEFVIKN